MTPHVLHDLILVFYIKNGLKNKNVPNSKVSVDRFVNLSLLQMVSITAERLSINFSKMFGLLDMYHLYDLY